MIVYFTHGAKGVEEGKKHLKELKELIARYNENNSQTPLRLPDFMMVIIPAVAKGLQSKNFMMKRLKG